MSGDLKEKKYITKVTINIITPEEFYSDFPEHFCVCQSRITKHVIFI